MQAYDYIIAGGGCAGLSLAFHLLQSPLSHKKILIVDRSPKTENDRTWCFWTDKKTLFDPILKGSWRQLQFKSADWTHTFDLKNWRYNMIRGIDFYEFILPQLQQQGNIDFVFGEIEILDADKEKAWVKVNDETYYGNWLFDSTFSPAMFEQEKDLQKYHYILQHFKGYVINSPKAIFNPDIPVLFDFNIPQEQSARFVYILPHSPTKALVEFTVFSKDLLPQKSYDQHLQEYIHNNLQLKEYDIEETEFGIIPMTDHPLPQRPHPQKRIMHIGTKGGRSKPSTGYTFWRIQEDSKHIVESLQKTNQPFYTPITSKRFLEYDALLLNILQHQGEQIRPIFTEMFKNNSIQRIFRFLNEESSLAEDLKLMYSVPSRPFLEALWKVKIGGN
ncbi:MAG: lycopene cyclase family protein [Chitinophagales bacterium]